MTRGALDRQISVVVESEAVAVDIRGIPDMRRL